MARKKKENEQQVNVENKVPRLSSEQYWKWRNAISEMWLEEKKQKIAELELQLMQKSVDVEQVKIALGKVTKLQRAMDSVLEAKERYNHLKAELESVLGVSLNGKAIDEFTLEIKQLPTEG